MPSAGTIFRMAWDIEITAANKDLRVTYGGAPSTVGLTPGTYRWLLDPGDPRCLLFHAIARLTAVCGGAWTGTIGASTGLLSLDADAAWQIDWTDILTTMDPRIFGCTAAVWAAAGAPFTATSPLQLGHIWQPNVRYLDDTGLRRRNLLSQSRDLAGGADTWRWSSTTDREIYVPLLPAGMVFAADATTETPFDDLYQVLSGGASVEWTPDTSAPTVHDSYLVTDERWLSEWPVVPMGSVPQYREVRIPLVVEP